MLLLFLIVAGLYYAKSFFMPLFIGGVLATLFLPFCSSLEEKKIPKAIAVFLCLFFLLLIISGFVTMLSWQIGNLASDIVLLKQKVIEASTYIQGYIFHHFGISSVKQNEILIAEQPSYTSIIQLFIISVSYVFSNFILVLVYFVFLLYYRGHLKHFFIKLTPVSNQIEMEQVLEKSAHISQQYLLGLSKMIVCLWIMYSIDFGLLGVKNFLFFAVLCGVLEIVPFLGNIIGTTLTFTIMALHGASPFMLGGIVVTYGVVQFIQGWFIEPFILGLQVKINPLFTIIALVLGQLIWGIPGIILAIPLTAIVKIMCDHV
ncbi:MAG: AI-2E family transporter [Bacteroidetes bacterium]|nr:AI-2E family transporter [Bacteroidota bacterium]